MFLNDSREETFRTSEKKKGVKSFSAYLIIILLILISVSVTQAATFTVDSTADMPVLTACTAAPNDCTLRGAVSVATGAGDIINFDPTVFATAQVISLSLGEIAISSAGPLTITGPGANLLTVSGSSSSRIFSVNLGATATITNLRIANGNGNGTANPGFGGGVYNNGNLTLTNITVDSNQTLPGANGGGIYNNNGTLNIQNSTISNNIGATGGGGIINFFGSTLTMTNSTVSGNTVNSGGGGGIVNLNNATVTSSTIANNTAPTSAGGGVTHFIVAANTFTSANSIYADNSDNGSAPDFQGTMTSNDFNLIENTSGTTFAGTTTNNITGVDPMLGLLQNNGGTTQTATHSLLAGSPAIDFGNSFGLTTDQRGFPRPIDLAAPNGAGDAADIGAFEVQAPTAAAVTITGRVLSPSGRGIPNAVIQMTDQNGDVFTARTNHFGYYKFADVEAGQTVIFNVFAKRYQFSTQIVDVTEDFTTLDFIAK